MAHGLLVAFSFDVAGALESIYFRMPAINFSSDFLQRIPEHVAAMALRGMLWSDWRRPARIVQSLRSIHKQAAFSQATGQDKFLASQLVPFLSRESSFGGHEECSD
jgi:hypothetical protein